MISQNKLKTSCNATTELNLPVVYIYLVDDMLEEFTQQIKKDTRGTNSLLPVPQIRILTVNRSESKLN